MREGERGARIVTVEMSREERIMAAAIIMRDAIEELEAKEAQHDED